MIIVAGTLTFDPAKADVLAEGWDKMQKATLEEPGCLGYDYYLDGRIEEARVVFDGLLAVAPRDPFALRAYAETCLSAGDHAAALRAANGLLALSTTDAAAYLLRGRVLLVAGRHEDASADLSRAARLGNALAADLLCDLRR